MTLCSSPGRPSDSPLQLQSEQSKSQSTFELLRLSTSLVFPLPSITTLLLCLLRCHPTSCMARSRILGEPPPFFSRELPTRRTDPFPLCSSKSPGLTDHELSLLFKRFSQATQDTHTVFGGSGLGLVSFFSFDQLSNSKL